MWLIVGLGNPGGKYAFNRHNLGFMVVDGLVASHRTPVHERQEHKAITYHLQLGSKKIILAKPMTYMNLSGESVRGLVDFYKIPLDHLLVVHDEADIAFGGVKFQKKRSPGGHNGIKSVHQLLGTDDYYRLRLGVGRPGNPRMDVAGYLLQDFSMAEQKQLPDLLIMAGQAVEALVTKGFQKAATEFNRKGME